jgi:hypothetical protein
LDQVNSAVGTLSKTFGSAATVAAAASGGGGGGEGVVEHEVDEVALLEAIGEGQEKGAAWAKTMLLALHKLQRLKIDRSRGKVVLNMT